MKIGVVTVDKAEQRSHAQKKRILKQYPDLYIAKIASYNDDSFVNEVPSDIIRSCKENKADSAVLKTVRCLTPDPEEFISACEELTNAKIHVSFIEEPWLNTEFWYRKKQTSYVAELHKNVVLSTYETLDEKKSVRASASKSSAKTHAENGTHPGPKKGTVSRETELTKQRRQQILDMSPAFNDTKMSHKELYTLMGISYGVYYKHVRILKERYPERVIEKK